MTEDGKWLTRDRQKIGFGAVYPSLGQWPRERVWKKRRGSTGVSIRLPGTLRVGYRKWTHYEWYVPTLDSHHRYLQCIVKRTVGLRALLHRLKYRFYIRWAFHLQFNNQDAWMVEGMRTPPEILYRPDQSIVAWRKYCEENARGVSQPD